MAKKIKIELRALGRRRALGLSWPAERRMAVDIAAHAGDEKALLDTIAHEVAHIASRNDFSESACERMAGDLSDVLWRMGWRRVNL